MTTPVYTLQSASRRYQVKGREVLALSPTDLRIEKGEFVVVIGSSGSGKSTLLMLLGGLLRPSSGRVLFENDDIYAMDTHQRAAFRARRIGFVFQTFHLIPYLNALENILVPSLSSAGGEPRALRARAHQLMDEFGIADRRTHRPSELSVGQRQRVAMARALLLSPDVLLADEPTGNLDSASTSQLMTHLCAFHKRGGTVVLVTHDTDLVRFGTRALGLENAKLAPCK
jgi:putative ABC transport system ATP-binding protein